MTDAAGGDLRQALAGARERLDALADRIARARVRLVQGAAPGVSASSSSSSSSSADVPAPFGGADARPIEDLELTFRAVDAGEGASDKAR